MSHTTCVTHRWHAAHILPSMHVIDAVKVCLACVANVHPLVSSQRVLLSTTYVCCVFSASITWMCKPALIQWQPSVNTPHKHQRTHRRNTVNSPSSQHRELSVKSAAKSIKFWWKQKAFEGFFVLFVSSLSSLADVTVKSWWASRPAHLWEWKRCDGGGWG